MAELTQIHNPVNPSGKPRIVFIHGLDGHFRNTWMANSEDDSTLWPKWVGEETGCPVWLLSYGAAMSRWKADAMALPQQATAILECLSIESAMLEGPLVLVGHSLGGLIIKTLLRQGATRDVERHDRLTRNVKGIVFIGTPHFGSRLASIAATLHLMRSNPQVSDLRMDNAQLEELNQSFVKLCRDRDIKVRVFTETQAVRLPGCLGRLLPGVTVVSPTSSQPHVPGEVGTPVDANHITICKPLSRSAIVYTSMVAFIGEIDGGTLPPALSPLTTPPPLPSDRFDAIFPEEAPSTLVHLAFGTYGVDMKRDTGAPVCGSVCLVTDSPERLRKAIEKIRTMVQSDPLVPATAKGLAANASLEQLIRNPITRAIALRALAVTSFSAYLYYCPKIDFDQLSSEDRVKRMMVMPIIHRLSKKGEHFEQVHTRLSGMPEYLERAAKAVEQAYHRIPKLPRAGRPKYTVLEELASLIAFASCAHLGDLEDGIASELFESLRTRIHYAENVATGEKHKRDKNPLP
ncbi:hypothetical protein LGM38_17750 [Burkholderia vietnamiensis]|uniref:esterase/lipase family protein n=1 Tax=Burkholderia vietnamiensis TaxID=60552 RepID=UPI001CF0E451|nr:hypothetical protein [Burkholderia vietnamiensis]MCA8013892.1 hypothetical protein [Burkholderia vietnamiensis]HDR8937058.1 hypothetical protein [Burkholderia vietnamiensis]HDR9260545.1 hypothetical protein [Burkholderia vietnamiensis]